MRFTKKPVTIDAVKWTGTNMSEIRDFTDGSAKFQEDMLSMTMLLAIPTLEGNHTAKIGDMIIKGVAGEFYPCKPDIFEQTYSEGESSAALVDVGLERFRQDEKWGGQEHDDTHQTWEFVQLIQDYAGWARVMAGMGSYEKARRRLVQVAALAVAAVESIDRKNIK
jgi:hypothetical protein